MATAKKTPSGMWKVRVYSHTTADGKKHYRAFTAPTKQEAEQQAAKFSSKTDRAARVDLTVAEAIDGYITAKEGVLSPSTVRGYRKSARNDFKDIENEKIRRLTSERVQKYVSALAGEKSAKSVKNAYALLRASVALYAPEITFKAKLPAKEIRRTTAPSDADIRALYNAARDWLKICIGLSAFGSLRRGEICALRYEDIKDGVVFVHRDMIQGDNGKWLIKEMPKTEVSVRDAATIPQEVFDLIGTGAPDQRIVERTPNEVTKYFIDLRDSLGMTYRFHDLRGFYASTAPILGVPDTYTSDFGGWRRGSSVLKEHYQKQIASASDYYAATMRSHFSELLKSMT